MSRPINPKWMINWVGFAMATGKWKNSDKVGVPCDGSKSNLSLSPTKQITFSLWKYHFWNVGSYYSQFPAPFEHHFTSTPNTFIFAFICISFTSVSITQHLNFLPVSFRITQKRCGKGDVSNTNMLQHEPPLTHRNTAILFFEVRFSQSYKWETKLTTHLGPQKNWGKKINK